MIEVMHNKEHGMFFTLNGQDELIFRYQEKYSKKRRLTKTLFKYYHDTNLYSIVENDYCTEFYNATHFDIPKLDLEFIDGVSADGVVKKENLHKMKETTQDILKLPLLFETMDIIKSSFKLNFHISLVVRPFKEITKIKLNNVAENRTVVIFNFKNDTGDFIKLDVQPNSETPKTNFTWNIIRMGDFLEKLIK